MTLPALSGGPEAANLLWTGGVIVVLLAVSRWAHVLDLRGSLAAAGIGLVVGVLGHVSWLLILLSFLGMGQLVTRWSYGTKAERQLAEPGDGARGWMNVVANGGMPALIAVMAWIDQDWRLWFPVFTAAVAVAAADTFASELGCFDPRVRFILTGGRCPPGTNGGTSPTGQRAALVGALAVSLVAAAAWVVRTGSSDGLAELIAVAAAIGWLGCQVDSVLGMWLENPGYIGKHTVNALSITTGGTVAWLAFGQLGW